MRERWREKEKALVSISIDSAGFKENQIFPLMIFDVLGDDAIGVIPLEVGHTEMHKPPNVHLTES